MVTQWGAVSTSPTGLVAAATAVRDTLLSDGVVWYVDSNGTAGNGRSEASPFATIDTAINAAAAGDTILVLEGHAESVANATTIIPDKAGLTIIGLGRGARRPTITFTNASGNIPISGAGTRLQNFLLTTSGTINVTAGITVTAADVELLNIEARDGAADSEFVDLIVGSTGSDRLRVTGLRHKGFAGGDALASAVSITATVDGVVIEDFNLDGLYSAGCIENVTNAATNMVIGPGIGRNRHATQDGIVVLTTTTTGFVKDVYGRAATHDADGFNNQFVGADMQFYRCLACNLDGEAGGDPKTASAAS